MNPATSVTVGMAVKAAVLLAVALLCVLGARLGGNYLIHSNPQWSRGQKQAAHALATFVAVAMFALFVVEVAGR